MKEFETRPKGHLLNPGFVFNLYKELLVNLRKWKGLVNYLNHDLGINWRNLSVDYIRDVPISILVKIILNYSYQFDRKEFVDAGARLAARIYDYAENNLDKFNDRNTTDPEEDSMSTTA